MLVGNLIINSMNMTTLEIPDPVYYFKKLNSKLINKKGNFEDIKKSAHFIYENDFNDVKIIVSEVIVYLVSFAWFLCTTQHTGLL
jgi:hypothetical protein